MVAAVVTPISLMAPHAMMAMDAVQGIIAVQAAAFLELHAPAQLLTALLEVVFNALKALIAILRQQQAHGAAEAQKNIIKILALALAILALIQKSLCLALMAVTAPQGNAILILAASLMAFAGHQAAQD